MMNMRWMKCSRHIKAQTELEITDTYQEQNLQYKLYAAIIHQVTTVKGVTVDNPSFREV